MSTVELLYREHITRGVRLAFLLTGDADAAEDIAHEAFLRCASRARTLRSAGNFGAYLARAIERGVVDHHRSSTRRARRERAYVANAAGPALRLDDALSRRIDVMEALDLLPQRQRSAVVLRYWLGYSEAEIAAAVGCTVGTVKSRLARARNTLRGALDA